MAKFQTNLEFDTANFCIRPLVAEDVDLRYLGWIKNPTISKMLEIDGQKQTLQSLRASVTSQDGVRNFLFGIFTREDLLVGTHGVQLYPEYKLATIGVMIGDLNYWGKGVPLETRSRLLDWIFEDLSYAKVQAGCYSINLPAIFNFKKQKWKLEGIRRTGRIIDGNSVDIVLFGMENNEWKK